MPKLSLEIVTVERKVYEADDVDMVIAPGIDGDMGILPRHTPILTALRPGELIIRRGTIEEPFAVGGGFMEVTPHRVIVMADTAEHVDEIDISRADEARRRAQELLRATPPDEGPSVAAIRTALQRSQVRLKVARRRAGGRPGMGGVGGMMEG
jgi:F-type H+-transporting ATPase subunit epsilon